MVKRFSSFMFLIYAVIASSCVKENSTAIVNNNIIGKWKSINEVVWLVYSPSVIKKDTTFSNSSEYIEFRNDSSLIWRDRYGYDTSSFKIKGRTLIIGSNIKDSMFIQTMSNNELTLFKDYCSGCNPGELFWRNFKR